MRAAVGLPDSASCHQPSPSAPQTPSTQTGDVHPSRVPSLASATLATASMVGKAGRTSAFRYVSMAVSESDWRSPDTPRRLGVGLVMPL